MISSIIITDLTKAVSASHRSHPAQNLWITLIDPEECRKVSGMQKRFQERGVVHFIEYFLDLSDEDSGSIYSKREILDTLGPKKQDVENLIKFLDVYIKKPENFDLGINCMAGVSRSTAAGVIAWVMLGRSPSDALDEILKVRRMAWPNQRILRFASEILGVDIDKPVADWKKQQKGTIIT